jgi:hypothetical protein
MAGLTGLTEGALGASMDFAEPASSPVMVGVGPSGIVAADLDGDGDRDLATVNISSGSVTILKNRKGKGRFAEPASSPVTGVGSFPDAIAAADLNGDSHVDLAVTGQVSDDVTILINDGHGGFAPAAGGPFAAGDTPVAVVAVNVDGDNDRDLAIADKLSSANIVILKNDGSAGFSAATSSPESAGDSPVDLIAANLDGDDDPDLAVANQQGGNVTVLANGGSGDFAEVATSPESAGTFPQGIVAPDLNGDHDPDLAVVNQGSSNVTVLRNNGSADFTEPLSSPVSVGMTPLVLAAADFDRDGARDIAAANHGSDDVTILRNHGHATLAEVATSPESAGDGPNAVVAADLNGDRYPDLAVANDNATVTILRNTH